MAVATSAVDLLVYIVSLIARNSVTLGFKFNYDRVLSGNSHGTPFWDCMKICYDCMGLVQNPSDDTIVSLFPSHLLREFHVNYAI